ncbi:hypothetical protein PtA15_10A434 [Puccinia triticina]|uniref:Uncharacterized protein n=1 Tax=Puccinia triticina TaxID=208348 RepID=A0ABY7CUU3_9BASI|nr:uncharacterized protein PtA15_10A434 [Puccinia triticina]WAQ89011.1 hypothetical protein PtA15_10A434 [Puccinia triticina]
MVNQPNVTRASTAAAKKLKSLSSGKDATEVHKALVPLPIDGEEVNATDGRMDPGYIPVDNRANDPLVFDDEEENLGGKDREEPIEPDFIEYMKAVPDTEKNPVNPISGLLEQALAAQLGGRTEMANK